MRIARCIDHNLDHAGSHWCEVDGHGAAWLLDTPATGALPGRTTRRDAPAVPNPRFDVPVAPGVVLIALENYPSPRNPEPPPAPRLFPKGIRTLVPHGADVVLPAEPGRVMAEPELAVVIGATARHLSPAEVDDHVFGFMCFNDVTAVFDDRAFDFFTAKASDTFGPCGPWVETSVRPADTIAGLQVTCRVDGAIVLEDNTRNLIFDVRHVVAEASHVMTLEPGDVISLGSPLPPPFCTAGQEVEFDIEGVGTLRNRFVAP